MSAAHGGTVVACAICGQRFVRKDTGRPGTFCSKRCRQAAWRARERGRNQQAKEAVGFSIPRQAPPRQMDVEAYLAERQGGGDLACRVCEVNAATVGPPGGSPILCAACART
jgi:hypothetical protein